MFQWLVMTNRALKRLVFFFVLFFLFFFFGGGGGVVVDFFLNMVPRYKLVDTKQRVTFMYILMSFFFSFHKV